MSASTLQPTRVVIPAPATTRRGGAAALVGTVALLGLLYALVVLWPLGRWVDERVTVRVAQAAGREAHTAETLLALESAATVAAVLVAVLVVGVVRSRVPDAIAAVAAAGLAALATETLKLAVLSRPETSGFSLLPGTGSFPSGHVTIAVATAVAVVRVAPPRARAVTGVVAATLSGLVGAAVVVAGWHRPGDVAAGVLVAVIAHQATALAAARLSRSGRRAGCR
ncbi:phosphatase PAP2 family protein [Nocardioides mangrovicus]|uniref:Phosphatase PAP2 family protein n=1 Tax=Nocardioides mangrovicus TaxID=2478913 RepID=A0A3L8P5G3_9ACTN|nr:phosphatase PAP2 family protein [Nocardioides mangrovicus]RLV50455.1 phosphatase PAP2 family protein [Nocardioides mangrovicus]